jgi:hypothetical protein
VPLPNPIVNRFWRGADVPCVNDSGLTRAVVDVPDAVVARGPEAAFELVEEPEVEVHLLVGWLAPPAGASSPRMASSLPAPPRPAAASATGARDGVHGHPPPLVGRPWTSVPSVTTITGAAGAATDAQSRGGTVAD